MTVYNSQTFTMKDYELRFDSIKSILLCTVKENGKNHWIKKINDIHTIVDVIEDRERFYLSCESSEITGKYMALKKTDGATLWFIPGKSFINILFEDFLYLIFSEENGSFYLLKVDKARGNKMWHHRVGSDLAEYSFTRSRVHLTYESGEEEILSPQTGLALA